MQLTEFKYNLSIVAIMKYEEQYVTEWVAFHRICGVQHFYIYDNNERSSMGDVLKPYIDQDIVTLIPWYGEVRMFPAYNHAISTFKNESEYIAYIDADEFLVPTIDLPIHEIVNNLFNTLNSSKSRFESRQVGGIGVNWKVYGTNHHIERPQGLVIENYTLRGETEANRHIKSIVNPRTVSTWVNPHYALYLPGYRAVSQSGLYLSGPFCNVENCSPLRINHYYYKSVEDLKLRLHKKKCDMRITEEALQENIDNALKDAEQYNCIEDTVACKWADQVKEELRSLNL